MTAVIYARYSSDNQREESIEGQIRECTAYAEKNGITVVKHYIDRALSAKTDNRPDFQQMIKDNETNQPIRLHDLMDFNRAFQQYDTPEGANCLTVGKRHLSQKDAAVEAVRNIGLNQVRQVEHTVFSEHPAWKATFEERLRVLRNAM